LAKGSLIRELKLSFVRKRICPGETLAMDALVAFMITFLTNFSVEAVPGRVPTVGDGTPALGIAPRPYAALLKPIA